MRLLSCAFENGGKIPVHHTCMGEDEFPSLRIEHIPDGTRTLALIMEDIDSSAGACPREFIPVGVFTHWLIWNIWPVTSIESGVKPPEAREGRNDFGNIGYNGPCPKVGEHRYIFTIYALDTELNLFAGSKRKELDEAMVGHIIESASLMGRFGK